MTVIFDEGAVVFDDETNAALAAPLDSKNVKERSQAGRKLSYIEGWHAIAEANRIFGFDSWSRETLDIRCVAEKAREIGASKREGWGVSYVAKVRVTIGHSLVREGIGSGHGIDVDLGLAHESAIKEAETDAMKRALMTFGNPFGLALYDKTQENVVTTPSSSDTYFKLALSVVEIAKTAADLETWWVKEAEKRHDMLDDLQRQTLKKAVGVKGTELKKKETVNDTAI